MASVEAEPAQPVRFLSGWLSPNPGKGACAFMWFTLASALGWPTPRPDGAQYGSRISLADQGDLGVAGESGAFVEPS